MKAVIEIAKRGSVVKAARRQLVSSARGEEPDFYLSF